MEQRILKLPLNKGNKLKEGHGGLLRERIFCVCGEEKKRRMKCEEEFSSYVWRGVHGKGVCKNQAWKEVVCSNTTRNLPFCNYRMQLVFSCMRHMQLQIRLVA